MKAGAFVTVRGFGPEFDTVLVNGRQIATPTDPSQASGRAFQSSGLGDDFHDKKFDKFTKTGDLGFNADWDITNDLKVVFDGSYSRAIEDPSGGDESYLTLLGYNAAYGAYPAPSTTYVDNTGNILPYTTWSNAPGGVGGGTHPFFQHVMLLRGYGVDDKVGQARLDFTYKGDDAGMGLTKMRWGFYFSHDDKNTALYSNDGGSGCTTCGYTIPAPSNVPIGVFNAGSGFLNGISGSGNLLTKWLTFNGDSLFNAITARQQALNPSFTFAPPMVNDTDVVEQVQGAYLEGEFGGNFFGRPMKAVLGARVEMTFSDISGLSTNFNQLAKILTDSTQYQILTSGTGTVGSHNHYTDILPNMSVRWDVTDLLVTRAAAWQTITRPTLEDLSPVTTLVRRDRPVQFGERRALLRQGALRGASGRQLARLNGAGQAVTQVRPRYQRDFGSTYHVNDYINLFFNAVNITNTPLLKYAYYGNQFLYAEDSGVHINFGVRANF